MNKTHHPYAAARQDNLLVTVTQLAEFDEVIDVRSEAEFEDDHIPGAVNCPVLDNAERARIGTLYKQVSAFDAKKLGAALVSRNIARHLEARFADRLRGWRPLIYCCTRARRRVISMLQNAEVMPLPESTPISGGTIWSRAITASRGSTVSGSISNSVRSAL